MIGTAVFNISEGAEWEGVSNARFTSEQTIQCAITGIAGIQGEAPEGVSLASFPLPTPARPFHYRLMRNGLSWSLVIDTLEGTQLSIPVTNVLLSREP